MFHQLLPYLKQWFDQVNIRGYSIPENYGSECKEDGLKGSLNFDQQLEQVFERFVNKMGGNYPFHHPDYAGQMLKPPHPVAWLAYSMAMSTNPNNHALDGGPPTSEMEKEVVAKLAGMLGFPGTSMGHLTSGGTIANLEALWVARNIHPDKPVLYSNESHYTHQRVCKALGIPNRAVSLAEDADFEVRLQQELKGAGTLVVTLGTTGTGHVEPLHRLVGLCKAAGVRLHVDAAYGGFFALLRHNGLLNPLPWEALGEADSIVLDPHKHGLQPYGCGCVLFKDPSVGKFYKHDSPYTYFSSEELHLGEITLECSRAGASAAALWFTIECFGLSEESIFARMLTECLLAARAFAGLIGESEAFELLSQPETDIVCYFPKARSTDKISWLSKAIFMDTMNQATESLYLSLYKVDVMEFKQLHPGIHISPDTTQVTVLRSVFMKPSHKNFIPEMVQRLYASLHRSGS